MCDNCIKHGEGKKWFLQAKNYSAELLADLSRVDYIQGFFAGQARLVGRREPLEKLRLIPSPFSGLIKKLIQNRMARDHYGQVVSIQEVRKILKLVGSVVRLPCVCRRISLGKEKRYCFGFSLQPGSLGAVGLVDASYWQGPNAVGLEVLTPEQALSLVETFNKAGLVHSIWTFKTPFIGGLCNCSPLECRAMLANLRYGLQVLHKGETRAVLDLFACIGCGACSHYCQFGALEYDQSQRVPHFNSKNCFGCGLCASVCPVQAINLE